MARTVKIDTPSLLPPYADGKATKYQSGKIQFPDPVKHRR
jgi:hypothetical protein